MNLHLALAGPLAEPLPSGATGGGVPRYGTNQMSLIRAGAARYGIHRHWVYKFKLRYQAESDAALEPRSRRPKTTPTALAPELVDLIVRLRKELAVAGLDAGHDRGHRPGGCGGRHRTPTATTNAYGSQL